jgi:hypothetical protein
MKLEIDLSSIFSGGDEDESGRSVDELIKEAVIERVIGDVRNRMPKLLDEKLNAALSAEVNTAVKSFIEKTLPNLMDHEFTETSSWGEKKGVYTVRNRILKSVEEQVFYKQTSYNSDKNAFTRCVDDIVEAKMSTFKKEVNKAVDEKFTREAMAYAEKALRERLGVKS